MRPAILAQLKRELPSALYHLLRGCFETQFRTVVGASGRSKLLPYPLRSRGYRRFKELGAAFGMDPCDCACKNPGMSARRCTGAVYGAAPERLGQRQLPLFGG